MKALSDFQPIAPDETQEISIDFAPYLQSGDAISSVSAWNCTVSPQSPVADSNPASRLDGPVSFNGTVVVQTVRGCLPSVIYVMEAVVNTVLGETLSIWAALPCISVGQG